MKVIKKESGFSIFELLIVMAIMGILLSIAIPGFLTWAPKNRLKGAANLVFSEIQAARMKAIAERNNYVITFDSANDVIKIYDDNNNNFGTAGIENAELVKTINIGDTYNGIGFGFISGTKRPEPNNTTAISQPLILTGDSPYHIVFVPEGFVKARQASANPPLIPGGGEIYLRILSDSSDREQQRLVEIQMLGMVKLSRYNGSNWE